MFLTSPGFVLQLKNGEKRCFWLATALFYTSPAIKTYTRWSWPRDVEKFENRAATRRITKTMQIDSSPAIIVHVQIFRISRLGNARNVIVFRAGLFVD